MEKINVFLSASNGSVAVEVQRKKIKNVNLKVYRDLSVKISAPEDVPLDWLNDFIQQRNNWIDKQITKYKQSGGYNNLNNIKSGSSTQILGKDIRIYFRSANRNSVEEDEKAVTLFLINPDDTALANRVLEQWWRKKAKEIFSNELDIMYESIFKKYDLSKPIVCIKKMKTLWGSCTPSKSKVTLNEYLLKADIRCIRYVVLHELTHLLHPYHNDDFYNFLTIQMPDWKVRKAQLDKEAVQGL